MSALTVDQGPDNGFGWDELVRAWEELEPPEGWKAEIIEGLITLSPAPANKHNDITEEIHRSLYSVIPRDWGVYTTQAVSVPSRSGLLIPDLAVVPKSALRELSESEHYIPARSALLIVEVTSKSSLRHDRVSKPAAYAHAGVPLYLLVDRWAKVGPTVTLYGEPKGDLYRELQAAKFGEEIHLPAPFDLAIETDVFPTI